MSKSCYDYILRDAIEQDFPDIIALNLESEKFLSPLNMDRLVLLNHQSYLHRVLEDPNTHQVIAFLLAFREDSEYNSVNYQWFNRKYQFKEEPLAQSFIYIDRIVIRGDKQSQGLGTRLYEDTINYAKSHGINILTCEYDFEPLNPISQSFHRKFKFYELGKQHIINNDTSKAVSMQICKI